MTDHGKSDVSKLKPCPFCGGDAILDGWENDAQTAEYVGINCCGCGAEMSREVHWYDHDRSELTSEVVSAWNRRTETAP